MLTCNEMQFSLAILSIPPNTSDSPRPGVYQWRTKVVFIFQFSAQSLSSRHQLDGTANNIKSIGSVSSSSLFSNFSAVTAGEESNLGRKSDLESKLSHNVFVHNIPCETLLSFNLFWKFTGQTFTKYHNVQQFDWASHVKWSKNIFYNSSGALSKQL